MTGRPQGYESITNHTELPEQLVITLNSIQILIRLVWEHIDMNFHPQMCVCLGYMLCTWITSALLYLNISMKMWVVLHLPACELKIVFFHPTVMFIAKETLVKLQAKRKGCLITM